MTTPIEKIDGSSLLDDVIVLLEVVRSDFSVNGGPRLQYCQELLGEALEKLLERRNSRVLAPAHR